MSGADSLTDINPVPGPPADLIDFTTGVGRFVSAPDLAAFVRSTILNEDHGLYNDEHGHLSQAAIGYLWTNAANSRHGRRIVGQAEIPAYNCPRWQKGRLEMQLQDWFGSVPDFVVTIDATFRAEVDDIQFLCLLEHELYHCGQAVDAFGLPKWTRDGRPQFAIRGHDIEEFNGVIRRYGVEAAGADRVDFIRAAEQVPTIGPARLRELCGSCRIG